MPARTVTTARQERLGAELRKLRERAGWSIREASEATGIAQTKISTMEAGRVGVSEERVRFLGSQYACGDAAFVDALVAMANERGRGWWEEYRGLVPSGYLDMAELEHHASSLRAFESVSIPGLLQTEEQIRAIFTVTTPQLSDDEIAARVRFRRRRQEFLVRERPARYDVVIHEAALRIKASDSNVARRQLLRILEQSELPQVTLRVVPFAADDFAGLCYPMLYAGGPVPQLDTVLMDTPHGGAFVGAEAQLSRYRGLLCEVEKAALGAIESRDFIQSLVQSM
ncbi:helix-turn-helix domain-containing protein [Streptomyces gilvosporeus]|uniref:Transcriptional regulator n=1 Tax=Streptomyces gilvosporeus TaxID=553510 RepID=A0A1V0TSI2_9ACTN|nr:helix-turn-helix transcriptional regulator [Streptomyces gilvosporeus]ARF55728.1 transcriptional regulator [Streptomyces gilvosporeus]